MASITDPNGNVTRATFDLARRPITSTTPATAAAPSGIVTGNSYDADGRLLHTPNGLRASLTDANDNTTGFTHDDFDRLITTSYPATGAPPQAATTESFTCGDDGNMLIRKTRADGTIAFTYDVIRALKVRSCFVPSKNPSSAIRCHSALSRAPRRPMRPASAAA